MNYTLRPNQLETINRINENLSAGKRVQIVMLPMGSGRSIIASSIIKQFVNQGKQTLVLFSTLAEMQQFDSRLKEENCFQNVKTTIIQRLYRHKFENESPYNQSFDLIISFCNIYSLKGVDKDPSKAEITIEEISNRTNCPIIYFEQRPIPQGAELPVISVNNTYHENADEFTKEINNSFSEELRNIQNKKVDSNESKSINDTVSQQIEALSKRIEEIHREDTLKLNDIHSDVKEILNIVKQINDTTQNYKDILQTYYELYSEENTQSEIFTSKIISKLMDDISKQLPKVQNDNRYNDAKKQVEIRLSNVLDKMDEESKKFLITAKFLFLQNMDLENSIDYSSICLLSSKAFEVELSKRLVLSFQDFLEKKGIQFENWPSSMISSYKKGNETINEKLSVTNFSLGSCPYIMGIVGKLDVKDYNQKLFIQFCNESLMSGKSQEEIESNIKKIDNYVRYVKDNFRNPAAHKQTMTISDATNCLDYILEVEKVLRDTLECFNY